MRQTVRLAVMGMVAVAVLLPSFAASQGLTIILR